MLLDEIIQLLSTSSGSLSDALLKTKVFLHQIGRKELADWANSELNGYAENGPLPDYRIVPAHVLANVSNPRARYSSHPIPLGHLKPEERRGLEESRVTQSLGVIEEMAKGGGTVSRPIPMEANGRLGKSLSNHFSIERAWCEIQTHDMQNIIIQVRSRLLDFLLEVKSCIGGDVTDGNIKSKASTIDARNLFSKTIFGPNTTIIIGDNNSQTVRIDNKQGDLDGLINILKLAGISESDTASLKVAISADEESGKKASFEGKTGNWLNKLLTRAAAGGIGVSVDVVSSVVVKALCTYMGIPVP